MRAELVPFVAEHLPGIIAICEAEGWPSLPADAERAHRVLTNPGVTTVVAVDADEVVGFIYMLSDGELQAFIPSMAVRASHRRQGIGRQLIEEAFRRAGGQWVDLLSDADDFYAALPHKRWSGFRIYPGFK
jgi:ribosomal protein S18 acetylase RimI-like enzyme